MKIGLAGLLCASCAFGFSTTPGATAPSFFAKPLILGAHRGGSKLWPENTITAFRNAAAQWPDALLEGDLQLTADGHVILLHDWTVDRTTDGTGRAAQKTLAELQTLDAGYWFTPDRGKTYPWRGQGVTLPTLAEVLAALPKARFLFELKGGPDLAEATVRAVTDAGALDRVALASFNVAAMQAVRRVAPHAITCYDIDTGLSMVKQLRGGSWDTYVPVAAILAVDQDALRGFALTPQELSVIQKKGIAVLVHTLNGPEEIETYLDLGVDSILTDCPDLLANMLAARTRSPSG